MKIYYNITICIGNYKYKAIKSERKYYKKYTKLSQ